MKPVSSIINNGIVLLFITTFFWGGNAVAGKLANGTVSPAVLTFMRWSISGVILCFIARNYLKKDWPVFMKNLPYFGFMSLFGYTGFNLLLYFSLTHTTAINVTIEQAAMPMFIFLLNFLIFRTKPFPVQLIGYVLTLIGVVLVVSGGSLERLVNLEFNIGDIIMIFAAFSYSAYSVGLRAKPDVHWVSFLSFLIILASIISVPFMIYEATTEYFIWPTTGMGWGVVLYAAIFPSVVCQAAFIRGNELLGANNAAPFLNLVPIFGALLSVLILGEEFLYLHLFAMALVIGGILIAQKATQK